MASDAAADKMDGTEMNDPIEEATPSTDDANTSPATTDNPTPSSIADLAPKMELKGKIVKIDLAGAFVDLGIEQPGFLHISQLSTKRVNNVTDEVNVGDEVTVYVLEVDKERGRISLTRIKPPAFLWNELQGMVNQVLPGKVVRVEKFGAFVDIGAERPGLVHVSELSDEYVGSPESVVEEGQDVEVRIIGIDTRKKQIDLSMKAVAAPVYEETEDEESDELTAMEIAWRRAQENAAKSRKRRKGKDKRSAQQSDILARTLQMQQKDNN